MNAFNNLSFRTKLTLPIVLIALILLIIALLGVTNVRSLAESADRLGHEYLPGINLLVQADRDLYQAQVAERSFIFVKEGSDDYKALQQQHDENISQAIDRVTQFGALTTSSTAKAQVEAFREKFTAWEATTQEIENQRTNHGRTGRRVAIDLSFGKGAEQFAAMRDVIDQLTELIEKEALERVDQADNLSISSTRIQLAALAAGLTVCVLLALFFPGLITRPLNQMLNRVNDISHGEGDLTARINLHSRDELGQLATAFDEFLTKLQSIIDQVKGTTTQVAAAAEQLSHITEDTTRNVGSQHAAIDQVATAVNEMSATVQEVARSAGDAAESARQADQHAIDGQKVVDQTITAISDLADDVDSAAQVIREVEQDSESIGGVLDVIRSIAEQTNLLALNAAIEAARAGEQGRGFAVVADEVRTLASRTQQSTEEIQRMIEKLQSGTHCAVEAMEVGQTKARSSVDQATHAGTALTSITGAVASISEMNTHIATASEEQSSVTEDINRNVNEISDLSNQSAQGAHQTNESSTELARLAAELQQEVSRFKT